MSQNENEIVLQRGQKAPLSDYVKTQRARYPGDFDGWSDDEVARGMLAKYPGDADGVDVNVRHLFGNRTDALTEFYSRKNGLDPEFTRRVIGTESTGKPNATSPKGAQGLMQVMPDTFQTMVRKYKIDASNPYDLHANLDAGTHYLREQLDEFGQPDLALAAYNAGPGRVRQAGNKVPRIAETQAYVPKILKGYQGNGYASDGTPEQPADTPSVQPSAPIAETNIAARRRDIRTPKPRGQVVAGSNGNTVYDAQGNVIALNARSGHTPLRGEVAEPVEAVSPSQQVPVQPASVQTPVTQPTPRTLARTTVKRLRPRQNAYQQAKNLALTQAGDLNALGQKLLTENQQPAPFVPGVRTAQAGMRPQASIADVRRADDAALSTVPEMNAMGAPDPADTRTMAEKRAPMQAMDDYDNQIRSLIEANVRASIVNGGTVPYDTIAAPVEQQLKIYKEAVARHPELRGHDPQTVANEVNRLGDLQSDPETIRNFRKGGQDIGLPLLQGFKGAVGSTVSTLGNLADVVNAGPQYSKTQALTDAANYLKEQGRGMNEGQQVSDLIDEPQNGKEKLQRSLLRGVGATPVMLAKFEALGIPAMIAEGGLSRADEGIGGVLKGSAESAATLYGMQGTGKVLSPLWNAVTWTALPTAKGVLIDHKDLPDALGESIPGGILAGLSGKQGNDPGVVESRFREAGYEPYQVRSDEGDATVYVSPEGKFVSFRSRRPAPGRYPDRPIVEVSPEAFDRITRGAKPGQWTTGLVNWGRGAVSGETDAPAVEPRAIAPPPRQIAGRTEGSEPNTQAEPQTPPPFNSIADQMRARGQEPLAEPQIAPENVSPVDAVANMPEQSEVEPPHYSNSQNRRVRNTKNGNAGQFKPGFKANAGEVEGDAQSGVLPVSQGAGVFPAAREVQDAEASAPSVGQTRQAAQATERQLPTSELGADVAPSEGAKASEGKVYKVGWADGRAVQYFDNLGAANKFRDEKLKTNDEPDEPILVDTPKGARVKSDFVSSQGQKQAQGSNLPPAAKENAVVPILTSPTAETPKGEHGHLIQALFKSPGVNSEGDTIHPFLAQPSVRSALGLTSRTPNPDRDIRGYNDALKQAKERLAPSLGKPRASHISPDDLRAWARERDLPAQAMQALDYAVAHHENVRLKNEQAKNTVEQRIEQTKQRLEKPKEPSNYQRTGVRRNNFDPSVHSLSEAIRRLGGVEPDSVNKGEAKRLSNKESGSSGLIRKGGLSAERMAERLWEEGYYSERPDPNQILSDAEEDLSGTRKHYSTAHQPDYEKEYYDKLPQSVKDEFAREMALSADPRVVQSLEEVRNGQEDEGLRQYLYDIAAEHRVSEKAVNAWLDYARSLAESVSPTTRPSELSKASQTGISPQNSRTESSLRRPTTKAESSTGESDSFPLARRSASTEKNQLGNILSSPDFVARANELAQRPIEEVIKGIKFSSTTPHRIKVNAEAYLALHGAYNSIESSRGRNFPGFTGVFNDPDYVTKLTNKLNEAANYYKRAGRPLWELSQAIKQAAKSDGTVILYRDDSESAIPHEEAHRSSFLASQGKGLEARHGMFQRVYRSPEMQKARVHLLEYYPDVPGVLVEEAYAHIAEGNHEAIGLTEDEAISFQKKWLRSFILKNGIIRPSQFEEAGDVTKRLIEEITADGSVRDIRGESRGREEVGRSLEKAPSREGEESSADASQALAKVDTNTLAFKRWFGSSKVVDEKGEPLVVYHGTLANFDEFDLSKFGQTDFGSWGKGIYLSKSPNKAAEYARGSDYARALGQPNDGTVMPLFVNIANPITPATLEKVEADLYQNYSLKQGETWADALRNRLIDSGYDGVYSPSSDRLMALGPEQIKSATGNRGTFDPSDPNILRKSDKSSDAINNFQLIPEKMPPPRALPPSSRQSEAGFLNVSDLIKTFIFDPTRTAGGKGTGTIENTVAYIRAALLSNIPATPIKAAISLTAKAAIEEGVRPLSSLIDRAASKVLSMPRVVGGWHSRAMSESFVKTLKMGLPDAWKIMRGQSPTTPGAHNFPGVRTRFPLFDASVNTVTRIYGAKAAIFYTRAFYSEITQQAILQADKMIKSGSLAKGNRKQFIDHFINTPPPQSQIFASQIAMRNIYMNENLASDITTGIKKGLTKAIPSVGRLIGHAMIPIDRVPSNAAIDLIFSQPIIGHAKALFQWKQAVDFMNKALSTTNPRIAQDFTAAARVAQHEAAQTFAKASTVGALFILVGAMLAARGDAVSDKYDKRVRVPRTDYTASLIPFGLPGMLTGLGASMYQNMKGKDLSGMWEGLKASEKEALRDIPVVRELSDLVSEDKSKPKPILDSAARLLIPQGIQSIGNLTDDVKRTPQTNIQAIEARLPVIRRNVPAGKFPEDKYKLFDPFKVRKEDKPANRASGAPPALRPPRPPRRTAN